MRVFSGIRADRREALGNYSEAIRQYVATQEQGDAFFCIVDLHSITVSYEPQALRESTLSLTALLFASGLDAGALAPCSSQSQVTAHAEAAWLLSFVRKRRRAPSDDAVQGKAAQQEFVTAGLFTTPC